MAWLFGKLNQIKIKREDRRSGKSVQAYGVLLDPGTKRDLDVAVVSIFTGILFTIITGFPGASPLFTAFLKDELGISNSAYGMVLTIPYLAVLIQIPYAFYASRHNRIKQSFILFAMLSKIIFVIPALLPLLMKKPDPVFAAFIIGIIMLFASTCNWIADSALSTWFGAMIPSSIKGRYFSTRQMLYTISALVYSLTLSVVLLYMDKFPYKYTLLFALASLAGMIDVLIYLRARPPERSYYPFVANPAAAKSFHLSNFLMPFRDPTYRAFLLFAIGWSFAINLTSPYFNVYLLRDLRVSLGIQTLLQQILPHIATILFMRRIGRMNDAFGFKPMLLLSCLIASFMPLTWILTTPESYWFIGITNFLSGIFSVAIDLAIMSLSIFLAPHQDRTTYLAGKSVSISLLGIVPAILIGGKLTDLLNPVMQNAQITFLGGRILSSFHILLIVSTVLRLLVIIFFLSRLKEENAPQISVSIQELGSIARFSIARRMTMLQQTGQTIHQRFFAKRKKPR